MCVAQASTYKSYSGRHPPPSVDSIWIAAKPRLFWVTSRQAPDTIWVDKATSRAIYAFSQRDTSGYPHQKYLDHGDLVEAYREQYENKTMPADCIGRKGVGGDYFPTEQCIADIVEHVKSGVPTTHHCMHDMWCFCQHDLAFAVMHCVLRVQFVQKVRLASTSEILFREQLTIKIWTALTICVAMILTSNWKRSSNSSMQRRRRRTRIQEMTRQRVQSQRVRRVQHHKLQRRQLSRRPLHLGWMIPAVHCAYLLKNVR